VVTSAFATEGMISSAMSSAPQEGGQASQEGATKPEEETWRIRTGLGTFELDPEVRQRLKEIEPTLRETAQDIKDVVQERGKLTPEEEAELRARLNQLRDQIAALLEQKDKGGRQ